MINTLVPIFMALVSVLLGIFGTYLTNWEKNIYTNYFDFIIIALGVSTIVLMFVDKSTSFYLFYLFLMANSWHYSTKFLFNKK